MISCPGCQRTLPDWSKHCQFCGADTAKVVRPEPVKKERRPMSTDAPKWVWWVYYIISAYWLVNGAITLASGLGAFGQAMGPCYSLSGALNILLGLGLILRLELIRGYVNVVSFLNMLGSAWGAIQSFMVLPLIGAWAALFLVLNVIQFCTSAFMIFLIGETDKAAPNI